MMWHAATVRAYVSIPVMGQRTLEWLTNYWHLFAPARTKNANKLGFFFQYCKNQYFIPQRVCRLGAK
jgi:hypothetical protein